jgi:hypothetical protein
MPRVFDTTPGHVAAMLAALAEMKPGASTRLASDPFAEIDGWSEVQIRIVPEPRHVPADARLGCSVAGGYLWQSQPPTLVVAESMSVRRQRFTLLHELGHHVQRNDQALGAAVLDSVESESFEDVACDAFAADILLPAELVDDVMGDRGPTVDNAIELFHRSQASRAAICVRLASRLATIGVFAVYNPDGTANFAASRGAIFPPKRTSDQSGNPLVAAALANPYAEHVIERDDARISYSTGHTSNRLYGQAAWCDGLLLAVMVEFGATWKPLSLPQDGTAVEAPDGHWGDCETCGANFAVTTRCASCGEPKCPSGHCQCTLASERMCQRCFLVKHPAQFSGDADICSECAE